MNTSNIKTKLLNYWPLISLILIAALVATALINKSVSTTNVWMHYFMGFFLTAFAMLKIFNIQGFAEGFRKYDILAGKLKYYALIYPFIELILGLGYFSFFAPVLVYLATIIVMTIGAVGVVKALRAGLNINCPCMGTVLNVPLSTVTLTEDIGMVIMAIMLVFM